MNVKVYTTTTCPYCKMLKSYLSEKGIAFTERLIDQDENAKEEMLGVSGGFLGVPFTFVEQDDGIKETIIGFDKNKINEVFAIKDEN